MSKQAAFLTCRGPAAYLLYVPRTGRTPKDKTDPMKKVTLHLHTSQWRALKVYAAQNDREMSSIVAELLEKAGIKKDR